jgi:hypothetical protein
MRCLMVIPGKGGARSGFQRTLHACPDSGREDEVPTGGVLPGLNPLMEANWTGDGFYKRGCQEKTLLLTCRGKIFF